MYTTASISSRNRALPSQFILEEGRLEELAEKTPPYSFLLYLDFLEDVKTT
jgi:hypothetical protein